MNTQLVDKVARPQEDTCGPCHPDAACIHGCKSGVVMEVRGDVSQYKNPEVVFRIKQKAGCSMARAEQLFEEMKQFLVSSSNGQHHSPSKKVDLAWHEFIRLVRK